MGSFFKTLRGSSVRSGFLRTGEQWKETDRICGSMQASSATGSSLSAPKRDLTSPLEKMLQDSGPVRSDGSDKFFGMENVSDSTFLLS